MSFNDFSSLVAPRTLWGIAADFLWLPILMYLLQPQQVFLMDTLNQPWSREQMGCEQTYLCLIGHGWVIGWWHLWLATMIGTASCFIVRYGLVRFSLVLDRKPIPPPDMQKIVQTLPFPHYC